MLIGVYNKTHYVLLKPWQKAKHYGQNKSYSLMQIQVLYLYMHFKYDKQNPNVFDLCTDKNMASSQRVLYKFILNMLCFFSSKLMIVNDFFCQ